MPNLVLTLPGHADQRGQHGDRCGGGGQSDDGFGARGGVVRDLAGEQWGDQVDGEVTADQGGAEQKG